MGAVTSLIYASKYPENVVSMVLDSPFSNFNQLIRDLAKSKTGLPTFLFSPILSRIENTIKEKTNCDLFSIDLRKNLGQIKNIACLFLTSKNDQLVPSKQTEELYNLH